MKQHFNGKVKKQAWYIRLCYLFNKILVFITLLAYILPFLSPDLFPILSVFTLGLPFLLILNILFVIFWILIFKRLFFLSTFTLLIGLTFLGKLYQVNTIDLQQNNENELSIMSYNVRLFNLFNWIKNKNITTEFNQFIKSESPDILCLQEYTSNAKVNLKLYPYRYTHLKGKTYKYGHAILSKYPIASNGVVEFKNSNNEIVFADIVIKKDTLRIYSVHLQSIKISDDLNKKLDEKQSKYLFKRLTEGFKKQANQSEILKRHTQSSKHPVIICGDLNNSAFSYVYRKVKGDLNDSFQEAGNGFGQTYHFKYYPARIDYIFSSSFFKTKTFNTFTNIHLSDHYPIKSTFRFKKK